MGLTFLVPAFLAGLAALAIPVAIHLVYRQRHVSVAFPSLMFLRKVPFRSMRRQRLRDRALFALRCLGLALLALAFARPFLEGASRLAAPAGGGRELVVLLDRSYSMTYAGRWDRAVQAARAAIEGLGPDDLATLVAFDEGAQALTEPSADAGRLRAALESVRPGAGATRYGPALKLAQERLDSSERPRREALLITDFQKLGWDGQDEVRLPEGAVLRWADLSASDAANVAVADLLLQRELEGGRERVSVSARLTNKGGRPAGAVGVSLEVDGRVLQNEKVELPANGSATVAFAAFPLPPDTSRGTVRVDADALPADDAFHFTLSPGQDVPVLLLDAPRGARSLYLSRALAIGNRPRFRLKTVRAGQAGAPEIEAASAVVLNDVPPPTGAAARALKRKVEAGAGLVVVLGERSTAASWGGEAAAWLPTPIGATVDRAVERGASLAYLDRAHPLFEPFRGPRTGDFSSARFLRYRSLPATDGVLARFDDGSPALVETKLGGGRILVWTSTLDVTWNDLALQPVFLPFVHQLVKHASGHAEGRPWRTVGEALDLSRFGEGASSAGAGAARTEGFLAVSPSGRKAAVPPGSLELEEAGFYELRRPGRGGEGAWSVAVNANRAESDLSVLDPEELAGAVTVAGAGAAAAAAGAPTTEEREQRQALWRYVLMGVFVILVVETAAAHRLSGGTAARPRR